MRTRVAIASGVAAGAAAMAYAVRAPSCSWLAPSVYKGTSTRRAIALTFDDGPSESTLDVLDVLDRYAVRATFFQIGANVRRLPHVARAVADAGHEIANHTNTHARLDFRSPAFIFRELRAAQECIAEHTGQMARFFRAPFGVRWFGLRNAQLRLGLTGVMWTRIGVDWKLPENRIVAKLARRAKNGEIFCLHDGRELRPQPDIRVTVAAVRQIVPILMNEGFHFERVNEILCPTN
ncbi:MAG: polysaccharide deacetylase family protein [Acidobacteriaceae bacterium]|nr:polysaccharide deacetylase family protein [Acidobacteriaceae bacterium]